MSSWSSSKSPWLTSSMSSWSWSMWWSGHLNGRSEAEGVGAPLKGGNRKGNGGGGEPRVGNWKGKVWNVLHEFSKIQTMNNLCVSISSLTMQSCSGVMVTRVTPKGAQKSVKSGVERVVVILCVQRYHQTPCSALENGRVAEWPIGLTAGSRGRSQRRSRLQTMPLTTSTFIFQPCKQFKRRQTEHAFPA